MCIRDSRAHIDELRKYAEKRGLPFYAISSASGEGIQDLVRGMADMLDKIPKPAPAEIDPGSLPDMSSVTPAPEFETDKAPPDPELHPETSGEKN